MVAVVIWLQFLSVAITIVVVLFTYAYAWAPGFESRHLSMIASAFVLMGVPTLLLVLLTAAQGKWAGVLLFCSLISLYGIGTAVGYIIAQKTKHDPFAWGMTFGMAAFMFGGGPAAVWLLP